MRARARSTLAGVLGKYASDRRVRAPHAALGAILALSLASCLPTIADRVDEIRAKLIGLKARDLTSCVGVPFTIDEDGETEFMTYRWIEQGGSDPFDRASTGLPEEPLDPVSRTPGDRVGRNPLDPLGRVDKKEDYHPPRGVKYCQLIFEVRDGRVQSVEVEGRRASGLNDDANCIAMAERCVAKR